MKTEEIKKLQNLQVLADCVLDEVKDHIVSRQIYHYQECGSFWSVPLNPFPVPKDGKPAEFINGIYSFPGQMPWCELAFNWPDQFPFSIAIYSWDFETPFSPWSNPDACDDSDPQFAVFLAFYWKNDLFHKRSIYNLCISRWEESDWEKES